LLYKKRRAILKENDEKTGEVSTQRSQKDTVAQRKNHKIRQTATVHKLTERSDTTILDNLGILSAVNSYYFDRFTASS
jgi:hypothetical protein